MLPKVGSNYGKALCTLTRARTNFGSKIQDFTRHNSKPIVCFPDSRLSNTVEQTKWSLAGGSRLQESRHMGPHPRRGPDTSTDFMEDI